MNQRTSNQLSVLVRRVIVVAFGTTAIRCVKTLKIREFEAGHAPEDCVKVVGFDAQGVSHNYPMPTVNKDFQDPRLGPGELIGATIGDQESRYKAENRGQIWMTQPNFWKDPGVAIQNDGAGGILRTARGTFALNHDRFSAQIVSCLRRCHDYQEQTATVGKDLGVMDQPVTQVYVVASLVGGTGPATFMAGIQTIAEKATLLKIPVRIVPILLLMGTLDPGDRVAAARNQQLGLRSAQAHFEGRLKPLTSNNDFQIACDPPVLLTNANLSGEMADLRHVVALVGQWLYINIHTPLGPILHQEAINLMDQAIKDHDHDLRRAATSGLSSLNVNKERTLAYTVAKRLELFFAGLVRPSQSDAARKHAAVAVSSMALRETPADDTAVQRLYCLRNQGNLDAQDRGRAVFRQRMGKHMGFRGCTEAYQAARHILEQEVPHFLTPKVAEEAAALVQDNQETIANEISRYFQQQNGLVDGPQFLEKLGDLLDASEEANQDKLANAQRHNKDLRRAKAACEKIYFRLQKKIWLFRWLHIFMMARFLRTYPRYVEALIHNELEIAARKLFGKRVVPGVRQALVAQSGRINQSRNAVQALRDATCQEINRLEYLPTDYYVPVGLELADHELDELVLADVLAAEGGESKAARKLFDAFCEKYHNLEAFRQHNPEDIAAFLAAYCQDAAVSVVGKLNVWDVFTAKFPTRAQQCEVIGQRIGESDGRIKTSGECYQEIARVKYVIAPDNQTVQRALSIANSISRMGGDWRGYVDPTATAIRFLQYRAGVSLTQQIRDTRKLYQLPDDPEELAQLGEDPTVALAPDTDVAEDKLDVTIAQALVSGQIHRNGRGCELHQAGSALVLGTLLHEIRAALAVSYEIRMRIYRQFCLELTRNQEKLLRDIEAIVANHASDGTKLAVSLDKTAFDRVRAQVHSLVPYTSRIRLDPNGASRALEERHT